MFLVVGDPTCKYESRVDRYSIDRWRRQVRIASVAEEVVLRRSSVCFPATIPTSSQLPAL